MKFLNEARFVHQNSDAQLLLQNLGVPMLVRLHTVSLIFGGEETGSSYLDAAGLTHQHVVLVVCGMFCDNLWSYRREDGLITNILRRNRVDNTWRSDKTPENTRLADIDKIILRLELALAGGGCWT